MTTRSTKEVYFPGVLPVTDLPADIDLALPKNSKLPLNQQHFLLYIPWKEKYLALVPDEFQNFFKHIISFLRVRTTDVHTAISSGYMEELISKIGKPLNKRVVALALFLHDSGWSKLTQIEIAQSLGIKGLKLNGVALKPKAKHAIESEKIAREVLSSYQFEPPMSQNEVDLICKAILYHDKPEAVVGADKPLPLEVQVLVDLDHLWSFTHENFWQDTVRKGIAPSEYLKNLAVDLDSYFVTSEGKQMAGKLLTQRADEVKTWSKKGNLKQF